MLTWLADVLRSAGLTVHELDPSHGTRSLEEWADPASMIPSVLSMGATSLTTHGGSARSTEPDCATRDRPISSHGQAGWIGSGARSTAPAAMRAGSGPQESTRAAMGCSPTGLIRPNVLTGSRGCSTTDRSWAACACFTAATTVAASTRRTCSSALAATTCATASPRAEVTRLPAHVHLNPAGDDRANPHEGVA